MRNKLLILLSIVLLSGCSSFYHTHYRKLDKVDVSGILAVKNDSISFHAREYFAVRKRNGIPVAKNLFSKAKMTRRNTHVPAVVLPEQPKHSVIQFKSKNILPAKQILQKRKSDNHLGGLIPVFLLLASVLFLLWGMTAFLFGIFMLSPVMIVAGILLMLIGGMPVLVQIRNVIANRRNNNLYEPKH